MENPSSNFIRETFQISLQISTWFNIELITDIQMQRFFNEFMAGSMKSSKVFDVYIRYQRGLLERISTHKKLKCEKMVTNRKS